MADAGREQRRGWSRGREEAENERGRRPWTAMAGNGVGAAATAGNGVGEIGWRR